jgi:hypothetical protein
MRVYVGLDANSIGFQHDGSASLFTQDPSVHAAHHEAKKTVPGECYSDKMSSEQFSSAVKIQ